jgi:two-component system CheB/CheR fusion protein
MRTLGSVEREVSSPALGMRYITRVLPYRSVDNFIAGVVVTFVDITQLTKAEERQRLLLTELQRRVRTRWHRPADGSPSPGRSATTAARRSSPSNGRRAAYPVR